MNDGPTSPAAASMTTRTTPTASWGRNGRRNAEEPERLAHDPVVRRRAPARAGRRPEAAPRWPPSARGSGVPTARPACPRPHRPAAHAPAAHSHAADLDPGRGQRSRRGERGGAGHLVGGPGRLGDLPVGGGGRQSPELDPVALGVVARPRQEVASRAGSARAAPRGCPSRSTRPPSSTTIRSARCSVERRCATRMVVRPTMSRRSVAWISSSIRLSIDEVASSSSRIRGSVSRARARVIRWRWPPESSRPRSPTTVS